MLHRSRSWTQTSVVGRRNGRWRWVSSTISPWVCPEGSPRHDGIECPWSPVKFPCADYRWTSDDSSRIPRPRHLAAENLCLTFLPRLVVGSTLFHSSNEISKRAIRVFLYLIIRETGNIVDTVIHVRVHLRLSEKNFCVYLFPLVYYVAIHSQIDYLVAWHMYITRAHCS